MSIFLIIHKLAIILLILSGILCTFRFKNKVKKIHTFLALVTVFSILIYLIQSSFSSFGYIVYGLLLVSTFIVAKYVKHKSSLWGHITFFVISILWLVIIHVV